MDSVPIDPLGSAQAMLPAVWVLPHFGWTSVLLVDGTRAWFEDEDLVEHGYGAPPFPHSDEEEKRDDAASAAATQAAARTAATAPAATSIVAAT